MCHRATCDLAAGTACDTVPIWEQKSPATKALSVITACLRSWLKFNFADVPTVKTCDVSCWRRPYFLICRGCIAGSTDGYVAGTSAVYETRFQSLPPVCLRSWHEFDFAGMPAVKTSWYVGVVLQAVPTVASRVLRRHMWTRLKSLHWVLYPLWISRDTESACSAGYCS